MKGELPYTNNEWLAWAESGGGHIEGSAAHQLARDIITLRAEIGFWTDVSQPPSVVFHYCRSESLENILRYNELWLFDSSETNDSQEGSFARELIAGTVRRMFAESESARVMQIFEAMTPTPYIACFSEHFDSLAQWRAYAGDATGFALGLDPARLGCHIGPPPLTLEKFGDGTLLNITRPPSLLRMIYSHEVLQQCIDASCREHLERTRAPSANAEGSNVFARLIADLHTYCLAGKHRGFREEREWRLVSGETMQMSEGGVERGLQNRSRFLGGRSRRYVVHSLDSTRDQSPVVEIVIGSRNRIPDQDLKRFLDSVGLGHVPIRRAEAPYVG